MTPSRIARFMASLFPSCSLSTCKLLDAGAGVGALSCAFIDRLSKEGFDFNAVEVTAYEIDANLSNHLKQHLEAYKGIKSRIIEGIILNCQLLMIYLHHNRLQALLM